MPVAQFIIVRTSFEGFHRWKDAPDEVAFLRDYHRHEFKVELHLPVTHADRQLEFFTVKKKLDAYLTNLTGWVNRFDRSCESLAELILKRFDAKMVKVSEDGQNDGLAMRYEEPSPAEKVMENTYNPVSAVDARQQQELEQRLGKLGRIRTAGEYQLPATKVRTNCFIGTECEGPYVGQKTLFVPGCVSYATFEKAVNKLCEEDPGGLYSLRAIQRIYLGAGNDPIMTGSPALYVLESMHVATCRFKRPVTIEVKRLSDLHSWCPNLFSKMARDPNITLLTHRWQDLWEWGWEGPMFAKEVRGEFVHWYEKASTTHHGTDLNHAEYAKDKEIVV